MDDDVVTITVHRMNVEAAISCLGASAADTREPERYRSWYENAKREFETQLDKGA